MVLLWVITKVQNHEHRDYSIWKSTLFVNEREVTWTDGDVEFVNRILLLLTKNLLTFYSKQLSTAYILLSFWCPHLLKDIIQ